MNEDGHPEQPKNLQVERVFHWRDDNRGQAVNLVGLATLVLGIVGFAYTRIDSNSAETRQSIRDAKTECKNDITRLENNTNARFDRCRCR